MGGADRRRLRGSISKRHVEQYQTSSLSVSKTGTGWVRWVVSFLTVTLLSLIATSLYIFLARNEGGESGTGAFDPPVAMAAKRTSNGVSLLVKDSSPVNESVFDRGLVSEKVTYESVLTEHGRYMKELSPRRFTKTVLGFVTPWNSRGYDVAKNFSSKFTHISPVWYQLKATAQGPELGGQHDVDKGWLDALRVRSNPKILPRFSVEGWPLDEVLLNAAHAQKMVNLVINEISVHGYDGLVLECWNAWAAAGVLSRVDTRAKAFGFVQKLYSRLRKLEQERSSSDMPAKPLQLFFVIPPPSERKSLQTFNSDDLLYMSSFVDAFPLMTYDFSNLYGSGPNAPLKWVQACLRLLLPNFSETSSNRLANTIDEDTVRYSHERELKSVRTSQSKGKEDAKKISSLGLEEKVLIGLNFYGYKYILSSPGGEAVVAHEYLKIVDRERPKFIWDKKSHEHYFDYPSPRGTARVYYPTLKSMALRISEARKWGAGISIWELGQGLDYFMDLF